jgi:[ribosomal protein S5]-alanine N-acetyltransferase
MKNRLSLNLLPITLDDKLNAEFEAHPDCKETLQMSIEFYKRVGYVPPWIGYFVKLDAEIVGSAGFKGKPKNNKVEIAYGTFPQYEGKGIGTEMCRQLVLLALKPTRKLKLLQEHCLKKMHQPVF